MKKNYKNKTLVIIIGSNKDILTKKIINKLWLEKISYILLDFDEKKISYPSKKFSKFIDNNFKGDDLIKLIKFLNNGINIHKECLFLFEFRIGFSKNKSEHRISYFVKKENFRRIFYNRRSFAPFYYLADDYYGISKTNIYYQNQRFILEKLKQFNKKITYTRQRNKKYLKNKSNITQRIKEFIKLNFYVFVNFEYYLNRIFKKFTSYNKPKEDIIISLPKNYNWFLSKTNSKFYKLSSILHLIKYLSYDYNVFICPHPEDNNSWFGFLMKIWNINIIDNIYSIEATKQIKKANIVINIGSTVIVDFLINSVNVIEIGQVPRVCNFEKGHFFIKEDKFLKKKLYLAIAKAKKNKQFNLKIPKFNGIFFHTKGKIKNFNRRNYRNKISKNEVNFLMKYLFKEIKIKKVKNRI